MTGVTFSAEQSSMRDRPPASGPIVVATDGHADSDDVLATARRLVGRTNADVRVVTVVHRVALPDPVWGIVPPSPELYAAWRAAALAATREQVARCVSPDADWRVTLLEGDPARELARVAHEVDARVLVLGRARHDLAARLLGELALRVMHLVDVPLLAVAPGLTELPRRVLVATDFSAASLYAAKVALSLADPNAVVYLAHVRPRLELTAAGLEGWTLQYEHAVPAALARAGDALGRDGVVIEPVTLVGSPGRTLADFAAASRADLVVAGTHGLGFFNRLVLGSVATHLLHHAPCSALIVPEATVGEHGADPRPPA